MGFERDLIWATGFVLRWLWRLLRFLINSIIFILLFLVNRKAAQPTQFDVFEKDKDKKQ